MCSISLIKLRNSEVKTIPINNLQKSPNLRTKLVLYTTTKSTNLPRQISTYKYVADHLYNLLTLPVLLLMPTCKYTLLPRKPIWTYVNIFIGTHIHMLLFPLQPAYIHNCSHCNMRTCTETSYKHFCTVRTTCATSSLLQLHLSSTCAVRFPYP